MVRPLCYVNKEYNLGILKAIILFLICLRSFQFPIFNGNKSLLTFPPEHLVDIGVIGLTYFQHNCIKDHIMLCDMNTLY